MLTNVFDFYVRELPKYANNRNHWRARLYIQKINEHIGGLRLTAKKFAGTYVGNWCNTEANYFEKKVKEFVQ